MANVVTPELAVKYENIKNNNYFQASLGCSEFDEVEIDTTTMISFVKINTYKMRTPTLLLKRLPTIQYVRTPVSTIEGKEVCDRLQKQVDEAKLKLVKTEYDKWKSGKIKSSKIDTKEYNNMIGRFIRAGLHTRRKNHMRGLIASRGKTKEEALQNRRRYMKEWRARHPGYNAKHIKKFYERKRFRQRHSKNSK